MLLEQQTTYQANENRDNITLSHDFLSTPSQTYIIRD